MKPLVVLTLIAGLPLAAAAASTVTHIFTVGTPIPDNNAIGLSNTQQIAAPITMITEVSVQLVMTGGWSGDLYAYLTHGSGFSVLLNRPGKSLTEPAGSGTIDLSVILADNAPTDIHTGIPATAVVSGFYQPDARTLDPDTALDTSPRSAFLSSFNGLDANGSWTLYVADVAPGDTMTLNGWSLTVTGVPEPSAAAFALLGMAGLLRRRRLQEGRIACPS